MTTDGETHVQGRAVAGRYQLVRELGRGGMGTVWLAEDQLMGRLVAVKELRAPQGLAAAEQQTFTQRALQEARSAARIHHPGAVTLHDILPATPGDDAVYLIMEYVDGPTLAQLIHTDGPQPAAQVAAWGLQLLAVLEAAHGLGIVHRDIKPANIMITAAGQVKLTDFGIAHTLGDTRLTRSGILGTQAYLAPELFDAHPLSPAADLWSLGATLHAAAAGRSPFDRETTSATLRAVLIDDIPAAPGPATLAAAITGLLQRDPARRATISQTRAYLDQAAKSTQTAQESEPTTSTPPAPESEPTTSTPGAGLLASLLSSAASSNWQSSGLLIRGFGAQAPGGAPAVLHISALGATDEWMSTSLILGADEVKGRLEVNKVNPYAPHLNVTDTGK